MQYSWQGKKRELNLQNILTNSKAFYFSHKQPMGWKGIIIIEHGFCSRPLNFGVLCYEAKAI